jgi:uncharacterized protein YecT (DUF1311 family)
LILPHLIATVICLGQTDARHIIAQKALKVQIQSGLKPLLLQLVEWEEPGEYFKRVDYRIEVIRREKPDTLQVIESEPSSWTGPGTCHLQPEMIVADFNRDSFLDILISQGVDVDGFRCENHFYLFDSAASKFIPSVQMDSVFGDNISPQEGNVPELTTGGRLNLNARTGEFTDYVWLSGRLVPYKRSSWTTIDSTGGEIERVEVYRNGEWVAERPAKDDNLQVDSLSVECRQYRTIDEELNAVYRRILTKYCTDTLFLRKLRLAQRAWLKFRAAHLESLFPAVDKRSLSVDSFEVCKCSVLGELTKQRIKELQPWMDGTRDTTPCGGSIKSQK